MSAPASNSNAVTDTTMPMAAPGQDDRWLDTVLRLRPNLKFDPRTDGDKSFVVVEDSLRGKFFQIGEREYEIILHVNGTRSFRKILERLDAAGTPVDESLAKQVCNWLMQSNLGFCGDIDPTQRLSSQAASIRRSHLLGLLNPISLKIKLFNPNRLLERIQPACQWFFSRWMLAVWLVIGVWATATAFRNWDRLNEASVGILSNDGWLWLLLVWIVLKAIHEIAHGIACRMFGGEVPEAGVLLLLFTPMAYVNVTSMWRFSNRWQRMTVAAAGMYVELLIAFVSVLVWERTTGVVNDLAFNILIMSSVTTILFNANPLMRFDGYFILSDLLAIPNLYGKGTRWFGDRLKSAFFGIPKTRDICPPEEMRLVRIYGTMAWFWKISISISLTIGASVLFNGAGLALAAVAGVLFFGIPLVKSYQTTLGSKAVHSIDRKRTAFSCGLVLATIVCLFTVLKSPATQSAPAIVQFGDEQILRAGADGFIESILVTDGATVQKGDLLIELKNPNLSNEVAALEAQADEARIQSRIYKQKGEIADSLTENERHKALLEQLNEKRQQANGLQVRAPVDGFVFERGLENNVGSFVRHGDPLLSLAQRQTKQIVVSVDQRDLESIRENSGRELRVAIPGMPVFRSRLTHIDPTASDRPTHPTLCADAGGPLPVRQAADRTGDDPTMLLLAPRFNVELDLDRETGSKLQSGQRGRAFFASHRQSMGAYLYLAIRDWLSRKVEQATQVAAF